MASSPLIIICACTHSIAHLGLCNVLARTVLTIPSFHVTGDVFPLLQTMIRIPHYFMGRNPELFEDPLEYKPERWLRDDTFKSPYHAFAFLPFGFGTRMCIGKCTFVHWNLPESSCESQLESSEGNHYNLWAAGSRHQIPSPWILSGKGVSKTQTPLSRSAMQPKWLDLNRRAVNLLSPCEKLQAIPQ